MIHPSHGQRADVVVVDILRSRVRPNPDTLQRWREQMSTGEECLVEATLGDEPDAVSRLCRSLAPLLHAGTQFVFTDADDVDVTALATDIAAHVQSIRPDCVVEAGPEPFPTGPAGTVNPTTPGGLHPASRSRVLLGDLNTQLPAGMVVLTNSALPAGDVQVLNELALRLRPIPVLCIEVHGTDDLPLLEPHLKRLLSADTPTLVISDHQMAQGARRLSAWLSTLDLDADSPDPGGSGNPARPDVLDGGRGLKRINFDACLDRVRETWPQNIQSKDALYLCQLKDWATDPRNADAPEAVNRVMADLVAWMDGTNADVASLHDLTLDLQATALLPPLPPRNIRHLTLRGCRTSELHSLPPSITRLTLAGNGLRQLHIDLAALPMLQVLNLEGNQFVELPACLSALPGSVRVYLANNPLDEHTIRRLQRTRGGAFEATMVWPDIDPDDHEDDPEPEATPPTPRLPRSVRRFAHLSTDVDGDSAEPAASVPPLRLADVLTRLLESSEPIDNDEMDRALGTPAFIDWLNRLAHLPYPQRDRFAPGLVDLVAQCMADQALRELVLAVVEDASTTCDDRVTLTWERLRLLLRCHGLLSHGSDIALDSVVALARQAMRQEKLSNIAHEHARRDAAHRRAAATSPESTNVVDEEEVEIHLAYLSQAAGPLGIDIEAGFGRFIGSGISGVSLRDVSRALKAVQQDENRHFVTFLTQWAPWLQVLRQLDPQRLDTIDEACADLDRLNSWHVEAVRAAHEAGVPAHEIEDAVTKALALKGREFRTERLRELTLDLLTARGHAGLLDPVWIGQ